MNKVNYDLQFQNIVNGFDGKKRLLLHACCAPCSSSVLERVTPFFDVTLYFYNPNITERSEYEKRLEELKRFSSKVYGEGVKVVDAGFYPQVFFELSKGLEKSPERGARCVKCYYERLLRSAEYAKDNDFDYFCTTLTLSPLKDATAINLLGTTVADKVGVEFLPSDFKKRNGYLRSLELSREYGLYRQNYCGCPYSMNNADE